MQDNNSRAQRQRQESEISRAYTFLRSLPHADVGNLHIMELMDDLENADPLSPSGEPHFQYPRLLLEVDPLNAAVALMSSNAGFACKNDPQNQLWLDRFRRDPGDDRSPPPSAPMVPAR